MPAASGGILEAAEAEVDVEIWDEVEMPGGDVEFTTLWAVRAKALNVISGMDRAFKGSHQGGLETDKNSLAIVKGVINSLYRNWMCKAKGIPLEGLLSRYSKMPITKDTFQRSKMTSNGIVFREKRSASR